MKKKKIEYMEREAILLTQDLKDKCEAKVKETFELAAKLWGIKYTLPEIRYDLKSLTAGIAQFALNRIRLHPIFLVENETDYITETIPHEVAHLLVPIVGPILRQKDPNLGDGRYQSHGKEWRIIMVALGVGPKPGQNWKDGVINSIYDPSSIQLPPRKKSGPRKPGGRKVGEIIMRVKSLNEEELEALKQRLGFEINTQAEELRPPTPEEIQAGHEVGELCAVLRKYPNSRGDSVCSAGWAKNVITELTMKKAA